MKKSYKKLLSFQLLLILILFLNNFIPALLSGYKIILFLLLLVGILKILFGFEKDSHRYTKNIIYDIIGIFIISLIGYYLIGIFVGFNNNDNYFSYEGLKLFVFPIIIGTIIKEFLRYNLLMKSEGSKLLLFLTLLIFILFDLVNLVNFKSFINFHNTFLLFSNYILPTISNNLLCTYLSIKTGYKPGILFLLGVRLYPLLPIVPNLNNYVYSIIALLYPLILLYIFSILFNKVDDGFIPSYVKTKNKTMVVFTSFIISIFVYFMSGYFNYYAIVIGSGSMSPIIQKGDVVIINKRKKQDLKQDQIIAYDYNDKIIVHRLKKIVSVNNEKYYYTKGDANDKIDNIVLNKDDILGIVDVIIPNIGWPSIWLSNI